MRPHFLAIAGALLATPQIAPAQQQPATVVMIVRHAERAPGSGDPPISDVGRTRAAALAEIGRMAGVSAIITTQLQRTRQTAEPLAAALGITIVTVPTGADLSKHVSDVAAAVRQQAGKTVLVVGHSNTVPLIVAALGGPRVPDLCEPEYDALFTVVIDEGRSVRTVRSRFGAPTPVNATCAAMRP